MSEHTGVPAISDEQLKQAIQQEYAEVAHDPGKGYHFHTGRRALKIIGYDAALYAGLPECNIASFAGTGNPFVTGEIQSGETVVDVGSGSALDALIASRLVAPDGKVIGIDMTDEMLRLARQGAAVMGADNIEFHKGLAEDLPLPDESVDVVISNGVLNLTLDKKETLREWARVLKPGGRLQIGDILVGRAIPQSALDDLSLWAG